MILYPHFSFGIFVIKFTLIEERIIQFNINEIKTTFYTFIFNNIDFNCIIKYFFTFTYSIIALLMTFFA